MNRLALIIHLARKDGIMLLRSPALYVFWFMSSMEEPVIWKQLALIWPMALLFRQDRPDQPQAFLQTRPVVPFQTGVAKLIVWFFALMVPMALLSNIMASYLGAPMGMILTGVAISFIKWLPSLFLAFLFILKPGANTRLGWIGLFISMVFASMVGNLALKIADLRFLNEELLAYDSSEILVRSTCLFLGGLVGILMCYKSQRIWPVTAVVAGAAFLAVLLPHFLVISQPIEDQPVVDAAPGNPALNAFMSQETLFRSIRPVWDNYRSGYHMKIAPLTPATYHREVPLGLALVQGRTNVHLKMKDGSQKDLDFFPYFNQAPLNSFIVHPDAVYQLKKAYKRQGDAGYLDQFCVYMMRLPQAQDLPLTVDGTAQMLILQPVALDRARPDQSQKLKFPGGYVVFGNKQLVMGLDNQDWVQDGPYLYRAEIELHYYHPSLVSPGALAWQITRMLAVDSPNEADRIKDVYWRPGEKQGHRAVFKGFIDLVSASQLNESDLTVVLLGQEIVGTYDQPIHWDATQRPMSGTRTRGAR